ncbi:MAG: hypothetical protein LBI19_03695 [Oscillospiraceae bacterium]|jgi:hypothetical protein|nr:hypothetical protein [Oscillospiraceae bacterium]
MKRKLMAVTALLAGLAIIITGTFAWQQIAEETNEYIGRAGDPPKVTIREDFDPKANMKDVFVENTGSLTMYVRVKLDEAMNLTNNQWRPAKGSSDWVTHTYGTAAINCGHGNSAGKLFHDYFTWTMGGWKYYMPSTGSKSVINDTNKYDGTEPGIKKTPDAQIVTAAQFLAMTSDAQKAFLGWIFSTDGYAYWSQPLKAGEATGLLLHGVKTADILKDTEYYYAINVIVEAVDKADIPMWTDGEESKDGSGMKHPEATTDGKEVIDIIVGNENGGNGSGGGDESWVNKPAGGFTPESGDSYIYTRNFMYGDDKSSDPSYAVDQTGSIHLDKIIPDGNYDVTAVAVDGKYSSYITIGTCANDSGKKSIIFNYEPTKNDWITAGGAPTINVQVKLTRTDGKTATITINMIYDNSLVQGY